VGVGEASAWTRQWWRWCGIKVDAEEERAHGMDSVAVREAVDEAPAWTQRRSARRQRGPNSGQCGGGRGAGA
jgi:hypothetical protein